MAEFRLDSRMGPETLWIGFCVCGWGCRPALAREVLDGATRHEREASCEEEHDVEIRFRQPSEVVRKPWRMVPRTDLILSNI
jgi:hypothetical protein